MATIKARRTVTLKGEVLKLADLKEVVHQAVLLGMPDDSEVRIMAGLGVTITAPLDPPPSLDGLELPDNPTLADVVTATAEALGVDPGQLKEAVAAALGVEYVEQDVAKAPDDEDPWVQTKRTEELGIATCPRCHSADPGTRRMLRVQGSEVPCLHTFHLGQNVTVADMDASHAQARAMVDEEDAMVEEEDRPVEGTFGAAVEHATHTPPAYPSQP